MDEKKRQELEKLRQQIDPDVLARVADAMGQGGAAPPAGGGDSGGAASKAPPRPSAGGAGLSDLKARIARREKELDAEEKEDPIRQVEMVVYHPSHFKAKQLGAAVNRMGIAHTQLTSDPQEFIRAVLKSVNDQNVVRSAMIVTPDLYPGLQALMQSEPIQVIREKLPALSEVPAFVLFPADQKPEPIEGLEPAQVLTQTHSDEFNGKRVLKALGLG